MEIWGAIPIVSNGERFRTEIDLFEGAALENLRELVSGIGREFSCSAFMLAMRDAQTGTVWDSPKVAIFKSPEPLPSPPILVTVAKSAVRSMALSVLLVWLFEDEAHCLMFSSDEAGEAECNHYVADLNEADECGVFRHMPEDPISAPGGVA